MKSYITILFLIFSNIVLAASFDGLYDDGGWNFVKKKSGFKIYSRPMPGSDVLGFKVEGHIDAPILDIMATLRSISHSKEWQPDLLEKVTLEDIGDDEAITYSRMNMPWPLDDRDYVVHNKLLVHAEKGLIYVISKSIPYKGWESRKGAVRASIGYSNIGLRPAGNGRTYVEWTLFGEPKGNIPTWVVNFYQQSFPIGFFKQLAKHAGQQKLPILPGLKSKLVELQKSMAMKEKEHRAISSETKK